MNGGKISWEKKKMTQVFVRAFLKTETRLSLKNNSQKYGLK